MDVCCDLFNVWNVERPKLYDWSCTFLHKNDNWVHTLLNGIYTRVLASAWCFYGSCSDFCNYEGRYKRSEGKSQNIVSNYK